MLKQTILAAAESPRLQRVVQRHGMRLGAARFVAGETLDDAVVVLRRLNESGLRANTTLLGEGVGSEAETRAVVDSYTTILDRIAAERLRVNVALKLTHLGLSFDEELARVNIGELVAHAADRGNFVRLDMERSNHTDLTLDIFETLWNLGYRQAGVVIQSYLRRSAADLERMIALGARVRLVKGAYKESRSVAFQQKTEVDASYIDLMKRLLSAGTYPAIATHDPAMIAATRTFAEQHGIPKTGYEFQMLYGIRRDLQMQLASEGHPIRVYVPFGREWFPYFMRRLGERPANVGFVLKNLRSDRGDRGVRPGSDRGQTPV